MTKPKHYPSAGHQAQEIEKYPRVILVATCSPCNARCPHCPCTAMPSIRETDDAFIKLSYFKKLVDESAPHGTFIRMSGYGEPLLHPHFFELMDYAHGRGANVSLITNGSLLDKEKIERLMKLELDAVEISVDSHREEIYKNIRVGLDFNKVRQNIFDLVDARDRLNKKTCIMVSIINQPSRNPDIEGARKYWEKRVDKVMIRKYVTWGILPTTDYGEPCTSPEDRQPCPYPFERLMIDPAGNFRLCPYDDQKLIPPLGHLSKNSVAEVWLGDRMKEIRQGHLQKKFNKIELCGQCTDFAYRSWTQNYRSALADARLKIAAHKRKKQ